MSDVLSGVLFALAPLAILANLLGVTLGIIFGALPGLTATMGIALVIPLTFGIPPIVAFSALLGVYVGAVYAGSITAILVGTPGTAAAAATLLEGPALTKKGESKKALSLTTISSVVGGLISCVALIFIAPQLAKAALSFGPPEYFALALFGLSIVAGVSSNSLLKGFVAALIGLFISTIGLDPVTGTSRFTFGSVNLLNGIAVVPALVGLFAISEVLTRAEKKAENTSENIKISSKKSSSYHDLKRNKFNLLRSSSLGTFIGIIPATGSGIASFVAYNECKKASKRKDEFGKGSVEGLIATESANSAVTGGSLIPLLTLGIPGDVITAVMLGALMIQGITPGPMLFTNSPDIISGIFTALVLANIFLLIIGLGAVRIFPKILQIPEGLLMPVIGVLCVIGSFAISNSTFDVIVMLTFGLLGYVMLKVGLPLAPLLLALILGPIAESNFRRSMVMSQQDLTIFFTRPISSIILIVTIFVIGRIVWNEIKKGRTSQLSDIQDVES
jgi:putative tricarboxylic transport membrane protein